MQNLLDPAILFFIFGFIAGIVKSNLEIPHQISRFLSLYLLMSLGLKGGYALSKSGFTSQILTDLSLSILLAIVIPLISYIILKRFLSSMDAIAVSATYGSVSAVTFITAVQTLENHQIIFGGHMAASMALMESPAIIIAIIMANYIRKKSNLNSSLDLNTSKNTGITKVLHESFTDGAQLLLMGAMLIGLLTGNSGSESMKYFSVDIFKGMLSFFLLDMGLVASKNIKNLKGKSIVLVFYGIFAPLFHATLALIIAILADMSPGNGTLLMVLAASASYIAVPAVLRNSIPEANPSLYFGMSLGITFPLNIIFGIPLYISAALTFLN